MGGVPPADGRVGAVAVVRSAEWAALSAAHAGRLTLLRGGIPTENRRPSGVARQEAAKGPPRAVPEERGPDAV